MYVSNMGALLSLTTVPAEEVVVGGYYTENDGGGGTFIWKAGPAPATDYGTIFLGTALTGGWFQRLIPDGVINAKWFGAYGDGDSSQSHNDTVAFQKLSAYINNNDGGEIIIPQGIYIVGQQTQGSSSNPQFAFQSEPIIAISNCTRDVVVRGLGAGTVLKTADGLYYGSFYPGTTSPVPGISTNPTYVADLGVVFHFNSNKKVVLDNLTVDGNLQHLQIGGQWGDTGYQLYAYGFYFENNKEVIGAALTSQYNALDGFIVRNSYSGATLPNNGGPVPMHFISLNNINSIGNGRQGLSWVGGNDLRITNGRFNDTGKTINLGTGNALLSAPGAGLDIEAEDNLVRNGYFTDCEFTNNAGCGIIADSGNSADCIFTRCTFIGTTNFSVWPSKPRFLFDNCTINGGMVHVYGSTMTPEDAALFVNCEILLDASLSPTGQIYSENYRHDLYYASNCRFDNCKFVSKNHALPVTTGGPIFTNCNFKQTGSSFTSYTQGAFHGETVFDIEGGLDAPYTAIFGRYTLNGIEQAVNHSYFDRLTRRIVVDSVNGIETKEWHHYSPYVLGASNKHDIVFNTSNTIGAGQPYGYVCTQAGDPGTWVPFGIIGMVQAVASPDSAAYPSATYNDIEIKNILEELRDLKNKLRDANILL